MTIMNEGAVKKMVGSGVKLGADASVAAGRVGATIGAATTTRFGEDLYVFAKNQGLFGGFAIDGSYIDAKSDWNEAYYGRPVQPWDVMVDFNVISGTEVASLHETLTRLLSWIFSDRTAPRSSMAWRSARRSLSESSPGHWKPS